MKLYQRIGKELRQRVRSAYKRHGTVRIAAASLGMPRATFHDWLRAERTVRP